ncbi:MAG: tyrosine-type recombinase/integrase [Rhodomicrobiaceae bacterium]
MAKETLTDLRIRKLKPPAKGQSEIWDNKLPGFGVRITSKGTTSFVLLYRFDGKSRRFTLGRYPILSLSAARAKAHEALININAGGDPASAKRQTNKLSDTLLFHELVDEFIEKYAKRQNKTWREAERILRRDFLPPWRNKRIDQITRADVNKILDEIIDRGAPSGANHCFAMIRRVFNWSIERGLIEQSPCAGMKRPTKDISRDRVLTDEELQAVWNTADQEKYPFGVITQLLILTGQRIGEVTTMRWQDIDLGEQLWNLEAKRNKSGRAHIVPLTNSSVALINKTPYLHNELLFPAQKTNADRPVSGISKFKARLDEVSQVFDWRMHDLRRTVATGMARKQIPPHVVERILNHKSGTFGGVAGVYNRFGYLPEMREALEVWEDHILGLINDKEKDSTPPVNCEYF